MDYTGKKCPVCSRKFTSDDDVVVCPKCGAPYHRECYEKEGKCIFADLHRDNEAWHDETENTESQRETEKTKQCKFCKHMNSENAVYCEKCGHSFIEYPNMYGDDENQDPNFGGFPGYMGGMPLQIDLMSGVKPEEDFDGVTGEEIAKYVKSNTIYYMGIFKRIKDKGKSRFNFAALLFGGGWMLYRKQYLLGTIFTLIMAFLEIASNFVMAFYSASILNGVAEVLKSQYANGYTFDIFMNELMTRSADQVIVALLPYVMSFLNFAIMIVLGFTANRIYYKHTIKQIKRIKAQQNSEEMNENGEVIESHDAKKKLHAILLEKGGTNVALAVCLLVCDMLISFVPSLFIR